ncbi:MAG: glycosyltransferase family 2 protein [Anaerolineales bacterium]|jgi:glycosyltransferase involved in cell wall biosynthesis
MIIISVVICTYNREKYLRWLFESLEAQTADKGTYEIIIVDNNSTDGTAEVSREFCQKNPNARYYLEEKQGLSHARNRGISEGRGEYIAFIDDDATAPENWVEVALDTIKRHSPEIFGGPYFACFEKEKPRWAKDEYWSSTEWLGNDTCWFDEKKSLTGGNLFIRRDLLEEIGGFDPEYGMTGEKLNYGEERDVQDRLRKRYPSIGIYYLMDLYIYHFVRGEKLSAWWYIRLRLKSGAIAYRLYKHAGRIKSGFLDFPKSIIRLAFQSVRFAVLFVYTLINRSKEQYPYMMNFIYEVGHDSFWLMGYEFERLRQSLYFSRRKKLGTHDSRSHIGKSIET